MKFSKSFNQTIYRLSVKLFSVFISCSLLVCCVGEQTKQNFTAQNQISTAESAININTASAQEIEKLPSVGETTAQKIVEHRERFGAFRKPEHLLLIEGVSEERFWAMRNFVKVE